MSFYYILGVAGAVFILMAFLIRDNKRFGVGTNLFLGFNLLGSLLLVLYALDGKVWPFVILNIVWLIDSSWSLMKKALK